MIKSQLVDVRPAITRLMRIKISCSVYIFTLVVTLSAFSVHLAKSTKAPSLTSLQKYIDDLLKTFSDYYVISLAIATIAFFVSYHWLAKLITRWLLEVD